MATRHIVTLRYLTHQLLGNRLNERFGDNMEVLGGIVLIIIGIRIVISHLMGA